MSPAILPQLSIAVSAGGGSAPSMPTMRLGTRASSSRATKVARLSGVNKMGLVEMNAKLQAQVGAGHTSQLSN